MLQCRIQSREGYVSLGQDFLSLFLIYRLHFSTVNGFNRLDFALYGTCDASLSTAITPRKRQKIDAREQWKAAVILIEARLASDAKGSKSNI